MNTKIGLRLKGSRLGLTFATLACVAVVAGDLVLARSSDAGDRWRWLLPLPALALYAVVARDVQATLGLRLTPEQGWKYWLKATLVIGAVVGSCIVLILGLQWLIGVHPLIPVVPWSQAGSAFLHMCVLAPLLEEAVYRLTLCPAAAALLGARGAIVLSGLVFAALHVVYGNLGPDNLIAGYFLAWAYLKSGTILVPVGLHSLGNLCALAAQLAGWFWLHGGAA